MQGLLAQAVQKISGDSAKITGASRTDAGVHARGQVANFNTASTIPPERWAPALNSVLPADIGVLWSEEVPSDFHSRYDAVKKIYTYSIWNGTMPSALNRLYTVHVNQPLNVQAMSEAVGSLVGRHDFSSFRDTDPARDKEEKGKQGNIREIYRLEVEKNGSLVKITAEGNGFLYHMVRIIAGTLIEVGRGKIKAENTSQILDSLDRFRAGPTAPPQGLCLEHIFYREALSE